MDKPTSAFYDHSSAQRIDTDAVILQAIRAEHPNNHITTIPAYTCNLLQYAAGGHASAFPVDEGFKDPSSTTSNKWRQYFAPFRRLDSSTGRIVDVIQFGKYQYTWEEHSFILYYVSGRDGSVFSPHIETQYLVSSSATAADTLTLAAGKYTTSVHEEIWVYNQGNWTKDANLWRSVQKASWADVILDPAMKEDLITNFTRFFASRSHYDKLRVPWKRGVIFHGPPGNGKTISIKATIHMLQDMHPEPIPTLYVKTLASFFPPEYSLHSIFQLARQQAPCFLVFEDLDSVVSDRVRSFFLNEVDGLDNNDGILMIGSTNHLELLDPGISKRPSRFDRKYLFPDPNLEERVLYAGYWQKKLRDNEDVEFPDMLVKAIAKATDGFSFAFIQEAFVAALLVIAGEGDEHQGVGGKRELGDEWEVVKDGFGREDNGKEPELDDYILWREIKKQIASLRKEIESEQ